MNVQQAKIVAAVQFAPKLHAVEENIATALQLGFEAASKGAKLIVMPELCLSGRALETLSEAYECAQDKNGYQTEAFVDLARDQGCHVVFGYVELLNGKLYNSAALVGPAGLLHSFQKHNLWGSDALWATPSEQYVKTVLTPVGRTGVLICRDGMNRYRESYSHYVPGQKFYRKGSVDTLCLLTNWGESYGYPDASWIELAEETGANVIVSNRVGKEKDMTWKGGSAVIDRSLHAWTYGSSFTEQAIVGGIIQV